jgi:arsenite-transporting ATPase
VAGKGGVGKTTCSAIFALAAARRGRTLLVTTDPASSLSAALNVHVGSEPVAVPGVRSLYAANVEAARAFDRWLSPRRALLATIAVRGTYLDDEDVARLLKLSLPGIDEVVGLLEIARMARGVAGVEFDTVFVDTAPTGHTLRLLASPVLLGRVAMLLDILQSHHRTVVSALRGSYVSDAADLLIAELEKEGATLSALLRDSAVCRVTWVTLPEPMALEETSDAIAALDEAGIRVSRLVVNRLTPPPSEACGWCDARRRFEARAIAPIARRFASCELVVLPELPREPRGVAPLRALGRLTGPWLSPEIKLPIEQRIRGVLAPGDVRRDKIAARRSVASALAADARWLLFGGKGGVGKSTCAAAVALDRARHSRVLLLSTDPAHSLGDVFGASFDNEPRSVPGAPSTLHVREIDAAAEMDRFRAKYLAAVDEAFARIARTAGGDQAAFRDIIDLAPPGIDEVIAVADVAAAVVDGGDGYDLIVTDTAPTGHALRLLQTPAVLREWTQALMALLLKYREIVGAGTLAGLLVQLSKRLRGLQAVLADSRRARFIVVTRAAALPSAESRVLLSALGSLGIAVGGIIVNATGAGTCRRCRADRRQQSIEIARLRRTLPRTARYTIIEAPAEVPPPHGVNALREWESTWRELA